MHALNSHLEKSSVHRRQGREGGLGSSGRLRHVTVYAKTRTLDAEAVPCWSRDGRPVRTSCQRHRCLSALPPKRRAILRNSPC